MSTELTKIDNQLNKMNQSIAETTINLEEHIKSPGATPDNKSRTMGLGIP
jgi:hypothetical protein